MSYTPPTFESDGFHCPLCGTYSHQRWYFTQYYSGGGFSSQSHSVDDVRFSICDKCGGYSIWRNNIMLFPSSGSAPLPNPDIPDSLKNDFEEARSISTLSPRSSAALLRLIIEKLTNDILSHEKGKDLNDNIKKLVEKGLPGSIQQALDVVRVIGNHAVHPGEINIDDTPETAKHLFHLVNHITDYMISKPKQIAETFENLPPKDKLNINKRDKRSPA